MRTKQELYPHPGEHWRKGTLSAIGVVMVSVVIETLNDEEGLARTLASLVGGAVAGVVREGIVCDGGSSDGTLAVADHAGCHVVTGGIAPAIAAAKGEWLLVLQPGARLAEGWADDVADHVARNSGPARFAPAPGSRASLMARLFVRPSALARGLLISRRQAAALTGRANGEALARGLKAKSLAAAISPASRR